MDFYTMSFFRNMFKPICFTYNCFSDAPYTEGILMILNFGIAAIF